MSTWCAIFNVASVVTKVKWRFRLVRSFFGLSLDYIKNIYEQFFYMKYYGGWSMFEMYHMPLGLRNWYIELLASHKKKENEEMKKAASRSRSKMRWESKNHL